MLRIDLCPEHAERMRARAKYLRGRGVPRSRAEPAAIRQYQADALACPACVKVSAHATVSLGGR